MLKQKSVELRNFITRKGLFIRIPIPDNFKELEPEITLGRTILDRALLDSLEEESGIEWFDVGNTDFNTICFIAYLDPLQVEERVLRTYKRLQERHLIKDILEELKNVIK